MTEHQCAFRVQWEKAVVGTCDCGKRALVELRRRMREGAPKDCMECGGALAFDPRHAENACVRCGLVANSGPAAPSPSDEERLFQRESFALRLRPRAAKPLIPKPSRPPLTPRPGVVCRHCGSASTVRNGRNASGQERSRCKDCRRSFVLTPKKPRRPWIERARRLSELGGNPREISATLKQDGVQVSHVTIWRALKRVEVTA